MANCGGTQIKELWATELEAVAASDIPFIWDGYLAPRYVTLLTSQWKSGKTTLLSLLLSRRLAGGTLGGRAVSVGKTAVISEEDAGHWQVRRRQLDLGNTCFFCRPFPGKPSQEQWLALLERLVELRENCGLDLVVVDSLGTFLPGRCENQAALLLEGLLPLLRLTRLGLAVLLVHHPAKGKTLTGQAARGSGALSAFADVLVEMNYLNGPDPHDRRRCLQTFSRLPQTPRRLVLELNADGGDYTCLGDPGDVDLLGNWDHLRLMLEDAEYKLTRQQILKDWPPDFPRPNDVTLWRWLEAAATSGKLCRDGDGRRNSPLRYWLPHKPDLWRQNPLFYLYHPEEKPLITWSTGRRKRAKASKKGSG